MVDFIISVFCISNIDSFLIYWFISFSQDVSIQLSKVLVNFILNKQLRMNSHKAQIETASVNLEIFVLTRQESFMVCFYGLKQNLQAIYNNNQTIDWINK